MLPAFCEFSSPAVPSPAGKSELQSLRQATVSFHDIDAARAAGYTVELPQTEAFGGGTCIANGAEGAMGIHLLSPGRADGTLDAADPDVLLYELGNSEAHKLTGSSTWSRAPTARAVRAGAGRHEPRALRRPATNVWTLHAWVWKPNPGGMFDPWNTRVTCD